MAPVQHQILHLPWALCRDRAPQPAAPWSCFSNSQCLAPSASLCRAAHCTRVSTYRARKASPHCCASPRTWCRPCGLPPSYHLVYLWQPLHRHDSSYPLADTGDISFSCIITATQRYKESNCCGLTMKNFSKSKCFRFEVSEASGTRSCLVPSALTVVSTFISGNIGRANF